MHNYRIFDPSLPDKYISELTDEELAVLIDEANEEHLRLEREIDTLCWPDSPQVGENGEPVNGVWPSEFSYIPALYRDEIEGDPALERRLAQATELSRQVGLVLAVRGTAKTYQAQMTSLKERINLVNERSS